VSPPGRDAGASTAASGPFERSSVRVFAPRRSKSRLTPLARFSTVAFANGPPDSAIVAAPEGSCGSRRIGVNFFASKKRRTSKGVPSRRVAFVISGFRETLSVK
jgi:hypothetical protein